MENAKLVALKLSAQRALRGRIYPQIRAIAVGLPKPNKLKVVLYVDREPTDLDYESVSDITGEICADFPEISEVEEPCIFTPAKINILDSLDFLAYSRKE